MPIMVYVTTKCQWCSLHVIAIAIILSNLAVHSLIHSNKLNFCDEMLTVQPWHDHHCILQFWNGLLQLNSDIHHDKMSATLLGNYQHHNLRSVYASFLLKNLSWHDKMSPALAQKHCHCILHSMQASFWLNNDCSHDKMQMALPQHDHDCLHQFVCVLLYLNR